MSPASSGPYKSRFFNFLNQQYHSLREQSASTLRHVKVTAVWGVQILLYPVYLAAQSARFAGHQLQQAAERGWPQSDKSKPSQPEAPAASDAPIQQVLEAVDRLPIVVVATDESTKVAINIVHKTDVDSQHLDVSKNALDRVSTSEVSSCASDVIRGVASLLSSRTLVLVTTQNQILDILTPGQQQRLLSKISWEIADYWRHQRLMQVSERQFTDRVLSTANDRHLLPGVHLFWEVMAWVQTGPVAIAANLFSESTLVKSQKTTVSESFIFAPSPFVFQQLTLLDRTLANLETHGLLPESELTTAFAHRTRTLLQLMQQRVGTIWQGTPLQPTVDNLRIQNLIRGAIDYFFGGNYSTSHKQTAIASNALNRNPTLQPALEEGKGELISSAGNKERLNLRQWKYLGLGKLKKLVVTDISQETPPLTLADADMQANTIKSLIQAAIDYFFGDRASKLPLTSPQPKIFSNPKKNITLPRAKQSNLKLSAAKELDPWLTLDDLFGKPDAPAGGNVSEANSHPKTLLGERDLAVNNSTQSRFQRDLSPGQIRLRNPKASSTQETKVKRKTASATKSRPAAPVAGKRDTSVKSRASSITTTTDTNFDRDSDWLETEATPTGYVKHPLEIVLGWLDSAMLLLEKILVKVWRWVRRLF